MEHFRQRAWLPWASVSLLAVLCGTVGILQYRWIGEITGAERTRIHEALQSRLNALSRAANEDISNASYALVPTADQLAQLGTEGAYAAQYSRWKESHERVFRRVAVAEPKDGALGLAMLDLDTAQFSPSEWPPEWSGMRDRMLRRLQGGGRSSAPPMAAAPAQEPALFEIPRFHPVAEVQGGSEEARGVAEAEWLLLELNLDYVRGTLLPELLNRYLGESGTLDYDAAVVANNDPTVVIYESAPGHRQAIAAGKADASVSLLDFRPMGFGGRGARGRGGGPGPGGPRPPDGARGFGERVAGPGPGRGGPPLPEGNQGRWRLLVWNKAGSVEALVARTRWRNLAISAGLLLLILATVGTLVRFSRQAERLAELQMSFVANVSHELRTPLTVIRTAAFNLRGKLASRPEQVARYGALIQAESERLTALVEQVLQFTSAKAGHVTRAREPFAIESLIEEGLQSSRARLESAKLVVEKRIDPDLPLVLADGLALRHALQNLVDNALKYGTEGSNWIGVFATAVTDENGPAVEIRIADHGPGIPLDEQERIFDPFFRGRRAIQDQVHGTGLGLNLVKKIVEAHGGSIRVKSEPMQGTEFIVRIPAAPPGLQDELAHSFD